MKKIMFPLEKLAISFFYFELLLDLDKFTYSALSLFLMLTSLKLQGARLYTPFLFLIIIMEFLHLNMLQLALIILVGFAAALFKVYDINVPIKGPYLMGHRYTTMKHDNSTILISVFYPTLTKGQKTQWVAKKQYSKVLYEIFHVDPSARKVPFRIFSFVVSYIHKIYLPSEEMSPYVTQGQQKLIETQQQVKLNKENKNKLIIFSHGLGAHLNAYSSLYYNWVSQGYTVISINHDHDQISPDYRTQSLTDHQIIRNFLFSRRNRDLKIRVNEINALIDFVQKPNFMNQILGVNIQFKEIILAGHSFGGGTVAATKASLNTKYKILQQKPKVMIDKIICLDPWFFPLQDEMYKNLQNENILMINSNFFFEKVPYIYQLQKLFVKVKENNPNMKAYMVKGMNHLSQCDMVYVFGNVLQVTGSIKYYHLIDRFMQLNMLMCQLFIDGKSKEQILQEGNKFVQQKKMDVNRVKVLQQYRTERYITFGKQKPEDLDTAGDIKKKI